MYSTYQQATFVGTTRTTYKRPTGRAFSARQYSGVQLSFDVGFYGLASIMEFEGSLPNAEDDDDNDGNDSKHSTGWKCGC